ncbi:type IV pilus twitching motility protein PilT [bacterium]|nr:type IV pilus twitching motility protein PilT [bacterium]
MTKRAEQEVSIDALHIDDLLRDMMERNASDLHICIDVPPVIRVDGKLLPLNYPKLVSTDTQRMMYDILSDEQIRRFEENWELDFSYTVHGMARFRVNIFKDKGAVAAAFRLIPARIPTIRELKLPLVLEGLTRKPRGLILVTGPTGSGKSTTLAAMINQINNERSTHIISIEDPIEYLHTHKYSIINQRELGQDTKEFSHALRSALREDPDVILVGEMRDLDTMTNAIQAAETGHLVLATLHTSSAAQTVDRIVDSFPPSGQEQIRLMLSNSIEAVLCQQLLPRSGQPGRICAMEVMIASPAIRNLIREAKTHQIGSIIQTSASAGMMTMDQHLCELYKSGHITLDEAIKVAANPEELKSMVNMNAASNGSSTLNFRG